MTLLTIAVLLLLLRVLGPIKENFTQAESAGIKAGVLLYGVLIGVVFVALFIQLITG